MSCFCITLHAIVGDVYRLGAAVTLVVWPNEDYLWKSEHKCAKKTQNLQRTNKTERERERERLQTVIHL